MNKNQHIKEYRRLVEKIKKARLEAGLSQKALAHKLNCSQSHIAGIEAGERRVYAEFLIKLSKISNKSLDYFLK